VGGDQPSNGDCLYLALEDNKRRLQRRLRKYFGTNKQGWPERLRIATKWKRLDQGGLEAIREWCKSVPKPTLIAIDTLKKVRAPKHKGQTDYDADYEACQGLQELAGEFGVAIIVAHHDRKMDAEDVFDTVSGTLGVTAGVDTIAIIKRRTQGTTLHIEGRDLVETIEKAITFDRETCRWVILGDAADVQRSNQRTQVLSALKGAPEGLTVNKIIGLAQLLNRNAADLLLGKMVADGEIEWIKRGVYGLPGTRSNLSARKAGQSSRTDPKSLHQQEFRPRSVDLSDPSRGVEKGVFGGATEKNGQKDRSKQKTPAEQMDAICPNNLSSPVERADRKNHFQTEVVEHTSALQTQEPVSRRTVDRERAGDGEGLQANRDERPSKVDNNAGGPPDWAGALAWLDPYHPPFDVSPRRWWQFVDDCRQFVEHWAARAQALGWEPIDLFGWDTKKPFPNIARSGLAWRFEGSQVMDMSEKTVSFTSGGSRNITLKRTPAGTGWMLAPD
jgi:hypothetical protein